MEKEKLRIVCTFKPHDIEFEQISPKKSIHIGIFPIPVGIETMLETNCKAYLIKKDKQGREIVEEISSLDTILKVDDQQIYLTYELEYKDKKSIDVLKKLFYLLSK